MTSAYRSSEGPEWESMINLMGQLVAQDPLALGNLTKLSARRQVMAKTLIDFLLGNMYMRQNH